MKMILLALSGVRADVAVLADRILVAYPTLSKELHVITLSRLGALLSNRVVGSGIFPRLSGSLLAYKCMVGEVDWHAVLMDLESGNTLAESTTPADGNEPVALQNGWFAWQTGRDYLAWRRRVPDGPLEAAWYGCTTGIATISLDGTVITTDENRLSVPGMQHPVRAGDLIVGADPGGPTNWAAVKHGTGPIRVLSQQDPQNPRCATDGQLYVIVAWGKPGVRLWLGTAVDLDALPLASNVVAPIPIPVPVPHPIPVPVPHPPPPVEKPVQPYNEALIRPAVAAITSAYRDAGREPDTIEGQVWIARMVYDYCKGLSWADSQAKHLVELRAQLGL